LGTMARQGTAGLAESASVSVGGTTDALYGLSQRLGQKVHELETEVASLREERDTLRAENEVIGEHIYGLQKENGMLHDLGMTSFLEKAQLAKQAEGVGSEVTQTKLALAQAEEKGRALAAENGRLRSIVEALQGERSQLRLSVKGLETTLESVKADLAKRLSRENALEQQNLALDRKLKELKAEKDRADQIVTGQHVEIAKVQQVLADLRAEKAKSHALNQRLETADMEIARCYQEKADLDQMISSLHVEAAQMKTQRDSALTEVPQLNGALRQQGTLVADLEMQVSHLQSGVLELQQHNTNLDKESKSHIFELDKARHRVAQQEQAISMLQAERVRLREAMETLNAGRAEIDSKLSTAFTEKGLMQSHLEQFRAEKEQLQLRAQQASSENAALRSRLVGLEKMVQDYQDETSSLQERCQLLREEKEGLQQQQTVAHQSRQSVAPYMQGVQGAAL